MDDRIMQSINAATSFLSGYQKEQEKIKEEKRVTGVQKKMQEAITKGDVTIGYDSSGNMSVKSVSAAEKQKNLLATQQASLLKGIKEKMAQGQPLSPQETFLLYGYKAPAPNVFSMMGGMPGFNNPTPGTQPTPTAQGGRIKVKSPDGKVGNIPQAQLNAALKAGYKRVQ